MSSAAQLFKESYKSLPGKHGEYVYKYSGVMANGIKLTQNEQVAKVSQKRSSYNKYIRLLESVMICPKVIKLNGIHCIALSCKANSRITQNAKRKTQNAPCAI